MKGVIVESFNRDQLRKERAEEDQRRFADLASELAKGGVEATVASIFEYDKFLTILDQEKPDIVFPAFYFVKQPGGEKINITELLDERRMPLLALMRKLWNWS